MVPTFNRAGFLVEALAALRAQTRPPAEIIVWDDGSTDGTAEAVAAFGGSVRYFRDANGGKARALNRALAEAGGDYVWICDDDDVARPDAAERLADALDRSSAGLAAGGYVRFSTDPATGRKTYSDPGYAPDLAEGSVLRHVLEDIFLFQNATLVRRAAYEQVGAFREDLPRSIDYDMLIRLAARFPVALVDGVLFEQRKHDGARGPLAARHAAARSEAVWLEHDRKVFADLRDTVPLSLYAAMFEAESEALAVRAGRIQRACVYARRDLWDVALEDLQAAARAEAAGPLSEVEWRACRRAMSGKHGCASAMRAEVRRRLAALRELGAVGQALAEALGRGAIWRGRAALEALDPGAAGRVARLVWSLGGPAALFGGLRPPKGGGRCVERRELPAEAYRW